MKPLQKTSTTWCSFAPNCMTSSTILAHAMKLLHRSLKLWNIHEPCAKRTQFNHCCDTYLLRLLSFHLPGFVCLVGKKPRIKVSKATRARTTGHLSSGLCLFISFMTPEDIFSALAVDIDATALK